MNPTSANRRAYVTFMRAFTWIYAGVFLGFLVFPETVRAIVNENLAWLPTLAPMPAPTEHFWRIMAGAMVAMLGLLCRSAARDPGNRDYAVIQLTSKAVSTAGFAALLFWDRPMIGYAVGIATDLPIAGALGAFLYFWPETGKKARTA